MISSLLSNDSFRVRILHVPAAPDFAVNVQDIVECLGHEVDGVSRLVIAEIKKPGVLIRELIGMRLVTNATVVTCYVLRSRVDPTEIGDETKNNGQVTICAMTYSTFVKRAEKRLLGLRDKLRDAPFLKGHGIDPEIYMSPQHPQQGNLLAGGGAA